VRGKKTGGCGHPPLRHLPVLTLTRRTEDDAPRFQKIVLDDGGYVLQHTGDFLDLAHALGHGLGQGPGVSGLLEIAHRNLYFHSFFLCVLISFSIQPVKNQQPRATRLPQTIPARTSVGQCTPRYTRLKPTRRARG